MTKKTIVASALIFALFMSVNQVQAVDVSAKSAAKSVVAASELMSDQMNLLQNPNVTIRPSRTINAKVKILNTRYLIAPGDNLAVSVYGEPDFNQPDILVRPDGFASIDPFGEMAVAGYSVEDLTQLLKEKLGDYLVKPKVSLKLNNMHAAKIYITGAVQKPGLYEPDNGPNKTATEFRQTAEPTVASVIANVGGIKLNADLRNIKITNNETGREESVDLMKMIEGGDSSQDIYLSSGDSVYVPELTSGAQINDKDFLLISSSSIAPADFPVRVMGAVFRPGVYNIKSNSPGINSALAFSEGFSPDANRKTVLVQRTTSSGNISKIFVNPQKNDIVLRPNDTILVSDMNVSSIARVTRFISDIIEPVRRASDTTNTWFDVFDPTRRYKNFR
ncbi:MAG: polysaccharide biosynthesis/export family protein [bacterium]